MNKTILPWLGWIVALLGFIVVGLQYIDSHSIMEKNLKNVPVYKYDITTFTQNSIPKDVLDYLPKEVWNYNKAIANKFSVQHMSGKPIVGLKIVFNSNKPIKSLKLEKDSLDSKIEISEDRLEAVLKKDELLEGLYFSGDIITEGIATVKMNISAIKGEVYNSSSNSMKNDLINLGVLFALVIMSMFVAWVVYKVAKSFEEDKENDENDENLYLIILLLIVSVLPSLPFSIRDLFYIIVCYLLITRYDQIIFILNKATKKLK